jgi:hypothetical protein
LGIGQLAPILIGEITVVLRLYHYDLIGPPPQQKKSGLKKPRFERPFSTYASGYAGLEGAGINLHLSEFKAGQLAAF